MQSHVVLPQLNWHAFFCYLCWPPLAPSASLSNDAAHAEIHGQLVFGGFGPACEVAKHKDCQRGLNCQHSVKPPCRVSLKLGPE